MRRFPARGFDWVKLSASVRTYAAFDSENTYKGIAVGNGGEVIEGIAPLFAFLNWPRFHNRGFLLCRKPTTRRVQFVQMGPFRRDADHNVNDVSTLLPGRFGDGRERFGGTWPEAAATKPEPGIPLDQRPVECPPIGETVFPGTWTDFLPGMSGPLPGFRCGSETDT